MKFQQLLTLSVIYAFAGLATAGSLTVPNTFISGEAARAAEVNDNFSAVKIEVDDNNARIDVNASGISFKQERVSGSCPAGQSVRVINADGSVSCTVSQNRVSGTCPTGQYMREINPDGSVVCEVNTDTNTTYTSGTGLDLDAAGVFSINPTETQSRGNITDCTGTNKVVELLQNGDVVCGADINTTYTVGSGIKLVNSTEIRAADGWVSVPHVAFIPDVENGRCVLDRSHTGSVHMLPTQLSGSTNTDCDALAPVHLPHGSTLSSFNCTFIDGELTAGNNGANHLTGSLIRMNYTTGASEAIYQTTASVANANGTALRQTISDTSVNVGGGNSIDNQNFTYYAYVEWSTSNFDDRPVFPGPTLNNGFYLDQDSLTGCSVAFSH